MFGISRIPALIRTDSFQFLNRDLLNSAIVSVHYSTVASIGLGLSFAIWIFMIRIRHGFSLLLYFVYNNNFILRRLIREIEIMR